jgi:16S rRNA (uracil1498-N3)-methyltransferase
MMSRTPRIHVMGALGRGATVALAPTASHHLLHVLRARPGDPVTVFDGSGSEFSATILSNDRGGVTVKLIDGGAVNRESPLRCTLVQAVSAGERMDYTLQKAVELGVACLHPVISERSVVRLDAARAAKRHAHWQQVVIAACEQCGRTTVPEVSLPLEFGEWLATLSRPADQPRAMLSPEGKQRFRDLPRPAAGITLLAGPEGGFAPHEIAQARTHGFLEIRLGPRILRTETAALAALSVMQTMWGDF